MAGKSGRKKGRNIRARTGSRPKKEDDEEDAELRREQQEELTALSAIFQEDFKLISEHPFIEYSICIAPHSSSADVKPEETAAVTLVVRYVGGYPQRPPKLQLSARGLESAEVHQLHGILSEQAAALAREGRVMVFNLVEAAQEFLSEHCTTEASIYGTQDNGSSLTRESSADGRQSEVALEETPHEGGGWEDSIDVGLFSDWWGEGNDWVTPGVGGGALLANSMLTARQLIVTGGRMRGRSSPAVQAPSQQIGPDLTGRVTGTKAKRVEALPAAIEAALQVNKYQIDSIEDEEPNLGSVQAGEEVQSAADKQETSYTIQVEAKQKEVDDLLHLKETSQTTTNAVSELLQKLVSGLSRVGQVLQLPRKTLERWTNQHTPADMLEEEDEVEDYDNEQINYGDGQDSEKGAKAMQSIRKDLLIGQLLRLACGARGPLPHSLPVLSAQLAKLGLFPQWTRDLLAFRPQLFDHIFRRAFRNSVKEVASISEPSTRWAVSRFWTAKPESLQGDARSPTASSRYLSDFEEISLLGRGGFGSVLLCVNKLDGRKYAVKRIPLKEKSPHLSSKILRQGFKFSLYYQTHLSYKEPGVKLWHTQLWSSEFLRLISSYCEYFREVATLSRLQHHHVVRYYQAWIEKAARNNGPIVDGSTDLTSSSDPFTGDTDSSTQEAPGDSSAGSGRGGVQQLMHLYIQMEYCPRTLRHVFDKSKEIERDEAWRIFRQLTEGLVHIHSQGIIHRDLTPSNVFFDTRGDIKIGDFGLAKFNNLEPFEVESSLRRAGDAEKSESSMLTGQVGTYLYTAPEIEQGWPHIDDKVDMYSLGVVLFELWHPFSTAMERAVTLSDLKKKGTVPSSWSAQNPQVAELVHWLMDAKAGNRPRASQLLQSKLLPPRMEDEALNDTLRTIQSGEDTSVYSRVVAAIFDEERIDAQMQKIRQTSPEASLLDQHAMLMVEPRNRVLKVVASIFRRHGALPMSSRSMELAQGGGRTHRQAMKVVDAGGNLLALRHETRIPFARWLSATQTTSLKRYEVSQVSRRAIGRSVPMEYHQGDFDIVGGARTLAEAEAIKVAVEVVSEFSQYEGVEVRINHRELLNAVWAWSGVPREDRQRVAQHLAEVAAAPPQSHARQERWSAVRIQLLQGLQLSEQVVDRLQNVERRLSGSADTALARLRGALPQGNLTVSALEELAILLTYLRTWNISKDVTIDALMTPTEDYFSGIFFQIHITGTFAQGCIAYGGRYDPLIQRYWPDTALAAAPGGVGLTMGVQKLISAAIAEWRAEPMTDALVCSRGGGGLLKERMEVVAELWAGGVKAEYLSLLAPSLTDQYEYARQKHIKWLIIITEALLSSTDTVKVRHLDSKAEEEVSRSNLVKFFLEGAMVSHGQRRRAALQRHSTAG
eukprot:SM000013S26408  [mRNA]  locus=s13:225121:235378:+ [translate_table: standard]